MVVVLFGVPEMSFKKLGTMVHIIFEGYNSSSFWLLPTPCIGEVVRDQRELARGPALKETSWEA